MYSLIRQIINFNQSSSYLSSEESLILSVCGTLIVLLFIVTIDWWRLLFKSLINKLK